MLFGMQIRLPPHPGRFVRTEVIDPLGLTVGQAAEALGITRQALSSLLNGHVSLTPEMAIRIEKAFGFSMEKLVQLQTSYDVAQARARQGDIRVARYIPKSPPPVQPVML